VIRAQVKTVVPADQCRVLVSRRLLPPSPWVKRVEIDLTHAESDRGNVGLHERCRAGEPLRRQLRWLSTNRMQG
jgi:hypothetical protein